MELKRKLSILSDAAKYDVSCSSSGSKGKIPLMESAQRTILEYVTAGLKTEGAFHYLKFYSQTNAFTVVNTASTEKKTTSKEQNSFQKK